MHFSQKVIRALKAYGPKSSLHGLYHVYQSKDLVRRMFWLVILLLAFGTGVFHTVMSAKRYLSKNIFVYVSDEAVKAVFPEITLCGMKPFSESLLVHYSVIVDRHFRDKWGYFDNWFLDSRRQMRNESDIKFGQRLKKIFSRFMEVVWVSEDSMDLGMVDTVAILSCSFEGRQCDRKNFTLVRGPDGWNCYNFASDGSLPVGSSGLSLVLFTDSAFFHPISDGVENATMANVSAEDTNDLPVLNSLGKMLQSRQRSLNQIAARSTYQSNGIRVIIHEPKSHPMMSLHRLEFESGVSGRVTINQMMMNRLYSPRTPECTQRPYKSINYVTDFDSEGYIRYRSFDKLLDDHVVEEKQKTVHGTCGCYSHRYPFTTNTSALCYYAPRLQRLQPSQELMDRMDCHDSVVESGDRDSYKLLTNFRHTAACDSTMLTFSTNVFGWPKNEDIRSVVNNYVVKNLVNGKEFLPGDDREHRHRIFNFSDSEVVRLLGDRAVSRQAAILKLLFTQNCSTDPQDQWCLESNERLRQNVLKLTIKLWRRESRLAKEIYSFQWPEALSEIGGICGLWLGMSALTLFELIEVIYIVVTGAAERLSSSDEGENDGTERAVRFSIRDTASEDVEIAF